MSGKIVAYFGADVSSVESGMQRAVRSVTGFSDSVTREAKKSADAFKELLSLQERIKEQKFQKQFSQSDDLGKAKLIQGQIRELVVQRNASEKGTAGYLQAQLEIEKRINSLTEIRTRIRASEVSQINAATAANRARFVSESAVGAKVATTGVNASRVVGVVKSIAGAFGAAGAAAGLIPGIGIAAIGLAAVVKGASMIREHYEKIAADAKLAMEYMQRAGQRRAAADDSTRTDKERLDLAKQRTEELRIQWRSTLGGHMTDLEILAAREAYEIAMQKEADLTRKVKEDTAAAELKASEKQSQAAFDNAKREIANAARVAEAEKKAADIAKESAEKQAELDKKNADEKKKRDEEETERKKGIADMQYERAWRFATDEQKIAQVRKEGQSAQVAYNKDKSSENLGALEKAKKKWLDLRDEINGAKKDADKVAGPGGGRGVDEDGKLTLRGAIVSADDAARSEKTRARNASLNRDAMGSRIRDGSRIGSVDKANKTDQLLEQIRDSLKPKAIK